MVDVQQDTRSIHSAPVPSPSDLPISVLVVDDQHTMRRIVRSLLASIQITQVREAANGQEALDILTKPEGADIDLIVCDLNMPHMDGLAFCNQVRRMDCLRSRHIPILILTGEKDEMLLEVVQQVGAAAIAHKPISGPDMRLHVQRLLGYRLD